MNEEGGEEDLSGEEDALEESGLDEDEEEYDNPRSSFQEGLESFDQESISRQIPYRTNLRYQ